MHQLCIPKTVFLIEDLPTLACALIGKEPSAIIDSFSLVGVLNAISCWGKC